MARNGSTKPNRGRSSGDRAAAFSTRFSPTNNEATSTRIGTLSSVEVAFSSDVAEAQAAYLGWMRRRRKSPKTLEKYEYMLGRFASWLDKPLSELTSRDLEFYFIAEDQAFQERWGRLPGLSTQRNWHICLYGFLKWCVMMEYTTKNPLESIPPPQRERKPIQWLTDDEEIAMYKALQSPQEFIIYPLLLLTGMRVGEAESLKQRQVNMESQTIMIADSKTVNGIRTLYIYPELMPYLRRWFSYLDGMGQRDPSKPLLVTASGKSWRNQQSWQTIKRIAHRAGVRVQATTDADNKSQVTPHTLRRTFATRRLAEGKSLISIAKWLGHANTSTLEAAYADFSDDQMRREMML